MLQYPITVIVGEDAHFLRLDELVRRCCAGELIIPTAAIRQAIQAGEILVNGQRRSCGWRVRKGDSVTIDLRTRQNYGLVAEQVDLEVLYEDEYLIAVSKSAGMLSHPSAKQRNATLINALLGYFARTGDRISRPLLVHRLDKGTSGAVLIAKNERAVENLAKQFKAGQVKKLYRAVVLGMPQPAEGRIEAPIGWHPTLWPKWRVADKNSKPAVTLYRVIDSREGLSLIEAEPLTGRTHQIRIHMAHIGHPLLGDHTYGRAANVAWEKASARRTTHHKLHSYSLQFHHPVTNENLTIVAPLPEDMW
ncbi:MAG: RluA family pseudouridine synthase [Acidobacteriota bacterium]|nr:RluA family pseudouridine synthase [Blastocatellia bacterium]MDW8412034.1 RluA family pseudouridine synthase [Acidobacteriota bacterium]